MEKKEEEMAIIIVIEKYCGIEYAVW